MSQTTHIQWTDYSSNPIRYRDEAGKTVWACAKVSDGCKNCYAETIAHRYRKGGPFTLQQVRKVTPYFDEAEARKLLTSKKLAGKRVFIGDMTDVFGEWVPFDLLDKLFAVFSLRPDVTFQVLTKRPERMAEYLNTDGRSFTIENEGWRIINRPIELAGWPLPNVWLGTSVEDQPNADKRIPELLKCPAAIRFLSVEPLLGPVDLHRWINDVAQTFGTLHQPPDAIGWVIVGGESGPPARPCDVAWVRSIRDQCKAAGVPCFIKQLGSKPEWHEQDEWVEGPLNGRYVLKDSKGGNADEWEPDLRVREFPVRSAADVRAGAGEVTHE